MSNSSHPLPKKKDVAMALLQGPSIFIHLDPRKPEVMVPLQFKKQPQLVLQVGLNMAISIPDLKVDDEGVTCTLSFSRRPFWCRLPWTAIYALVGEALEGEEMKGMLWPEDVPAEIAAQRDAKGPEAPTQRPRAARDSKRRAPVAAMRRSDPSPATSPPPSSVSPSSDKPESAPAALVPTAASAAMSQPKRDVSKSGKRELPPYLRVVK